MSCPLKPYPQPARLVGLEQRLLNSVDLAVKDDVRFLDRAVIGDLMPNITGSFVAKNLGTTQTPGPVAYRAVVSASDDLSVDVQQIGRGTIPAIGADDEQQVDFQFTAPAGYRGSDLAFGIILDPDNLVEESDESNNAGENDFGVSFVDTLSDGVIPCTEEDDFIRLFSYAEDLVLIIRAGRDTDTMWLAPGNGPNLVANLGAGSDRLTASESLPRGLTVDGGPGTDYIQGGAGADLLSGGDGWDWVRGYGGNDTIRGGSAWDRLFGDDGDDLLVGNGGGDWLNGGAGNDILSGNGGNDTLFGHDGDDQLLGGSGRDDLRGQSGSDSVRGGGGRDVAIADMDDILTGIEVIRG